MESPSRSVACNADMAGEYYDSFNDVDKHLVDYFTYKALRVVLQQLQEMDTSPGKKEYTWLYQFAVDHSVRDSRLFIKVRDTEHAHRTRYSYPDMCVPHRKDSDSLTNK